MIQACVFATLLLTLVRHSTAQDNGGASGSVCSQSCAARRQLSSTKQTYTIGVLANQGIDAAISRHNVTFGEYLTFTAGKRFDPPVEFRMRPVEFGDIYSGVETGLFDFLYVSPSPFACIDAQYGAQSLVSHIAKDSFEGTPYNLTQYAGVIFARSDRSDINSIFDLRGKSVAAISISGLAAAQLQFREMTQAGLSYVNNPSKLVFTGNQRKTLEGVLSGRFDVGFVRTSVIERYRDAEGNPVDFSQIKIIEQKLNTIDGNLPFPYVASTRLYPEWNLAALTHVPQEISEEVQDAMLALARHAEVGFAIEDCMTKMGDADFCQDVNLVAPNRPRCDTTFDIAVTASKAMSNGRYAGFRTTLSYTDINLLLLDNNFIRKDKETDVWSCVRSSTLYDAITCPEGHFRRPRRLVDRGCEDAGTPCDPNMGETCLCRPCVKAFDVAIFPVSDKNVGEEAGLDPVYNDNGGSVVIGCPKMSICGQVEQTKTIIFRAIDHKEREGAVMHVIVHEGERTRDVYVNQSEEADFIYHFEVSSANIGILVLEIGIEGEQIPESPLRVQVVKRNCAADLSDGSRVPDENGKCICKADTVEIGGNCIGNDVIYSSIFVPLAVLCFAFAYWQIVRHQRKADTVWKIKPKDLKFANPPVVIGQGTFGLVLLADYHGTQVAVKKVMPPPSKKKNRSGSRGKSRQNNPDSATHVASTITPHSIPEQLSSNGQQEQPPLERDNASLGTNDHSIDDLSVDNLSVDNLSVDTLRSKDTIGLDLEARPMTRWGRGNLNKQFTTDRMKSYDAASLAKIMDGKMGGRTSAVLAAKRKNRVSEKGITSTGMLEESSNGSGRSSNNSSFLGFRRTSSFATQKAEFIEEMRTISKLRHPSITTILGAVIGKNTEPMLVMEYLACGSLHDLLHNKSMVLDGNMMLNILQDIAQGVRFLHSSTPQIIHGDLKSANILISSKLQAKVADFGLSSKSKKSKAAGTPYWMAPELLRGESGNTTASDIYSVGIIIYETYSRKNPYEGERYSEVIRLVCDKKVNKRPPVPTIMPPKVQKLMRFALMANPKLRPNAEALDNRLNEIDATSDLLHQVFPKHIAKVLASGGKVDPQSHELVTIFFSDIIGFTNMASTLSPLKVSSLLDRLYLSFDAAVKRHDVFKIETIGDSYMCATNLSGDQDHDHAERIAEFAIEVVRIASETLVDEADPEMGYVSIRAGFHSGPVVSNVVGSLNPRFSLFGDTVNVASRMESTSEAGRIQCTEQSYNLLRSQAPLIPIKKRGETDVKGKGAIKSYWVNEWS